MTGYLFEPAEVASLPVSGSDHRFALRRVFCVGRNYEAHAKEMGLEVDREAPFYFTKSVVHLAQSGAAVPYPKGTANYHYEMELAVCLGPDGPAGYACALDMTRRDLQLKERKKQRPWSLGKDVEGGLVLGAMKLASEWSPTPETPITLDQNGRRRQDAVLGDMVWSVTEILEHLSGFYDLGAGDVILTGTPEGVGPVEAGDQLLGQIEGLEPVSLSITA